MTTIACPKTGDPFEFELPGDETTLGDYWQVLLNIHCPACDTIHAVPFREAYVAGVMTELRCVPVDIQQAIVQ